MSWLFLRRLVMPVLMYVQGQQLMKILPQEVDEMGAILRG